MVDDNDIIMA